MLLLEKEQKGIYLSIYKLELEMEQKRKKVLQDFFFLQSLTITKSRIYWTADTFPGSWKAVQYFEI